MARSQHVKTYTLGMIVSTLAMVLAATMGCSGPRAAPADSSQSPQQEKRAMPSTTSADDIRHLAQLAIDLPALEKYFHPEVPGRKPLCVVHNQVFRDQPALTKFGQPVRYVTPAEAASGSPCVEFSRVEVSGSSATAELAYKVEGIRVTVQYRKTGDTWRVENHTLAET